MTIKEMAYKIEALQIEAEKIHSLEIAIMEALLYGYNAPKTYEWALCLLGDLTHAMRGELSTARDELFDMIKN